MRCESYGESMMFTLPANENNLGNPMIPAIHGGVLAGFHGNSGDDSTDGVTTNADNS